MGRGVVLILNNETFDIENISERRNSRKDVMAIEKVFFKFNYNVCKVPNPTLEDIRQNLNELLIKPLETASCLVVVLMSHGLENDHAFAKDQVYNIGEVILKSRAFQDFKDLPKILIVQACKTADKKFQANTVCDTPRVYNTFRYNSCFEGGKSVRADRGSLFIQRLCENLYKYGLDEDLEEIASNRVNKIFESEYRQTGINQTPTIVKYNQGFRPFCFGNYLN